MINKRNYEDLLSGLDILALERTGVDSFSTVGRLPAWCQLVFNEDDLEQDTWKPQETMPFLDNFLIDANNFWERKAIGRIRSGPWVESLSRGFELPLEASAICLDNVDVLLIKHLGEGYSRLKKMLQTGREGLLAQDQLERVVRARTQDIRQREEEIAQRLVIAAESRDGETGAHIRRLGLYSAEVAEALGWPLNKVDDIRVAAPMHDIGKIGIPDRVLLKPGRLDPDEFEVIKQHPSIGGNILRGSDSEMIQMAADVCEGHHEKWDGSGYPQGLKGDEIPASARIVAIADVFDALMQKRCYKPAFGLNETLDIMQADRGTHFDPNIFDCFIEILPAMIRIREENPG
jgi:hypothetical protein